MSVGRNDPCPCGSGMKHKKCCGAVMPIATAARTCGGCTACCDGWVVGVLEGYEMKPGTPCHFRGDHECTIYDRRPAIPAAASLADARSPAVRFPTSSARTSWA